MLFTYTPPGNHIVNFLQWSCQIVLKLLTRAAAHNVTRQARLDSLPHPAMAIGACPRRRSWCITIMWIDSKDLVTVRTYRATAQFHWLQQARDLRGSTYQTIDNVNEWCSRGRNQGHLPLLKRTHTILEEGWSPSVLCIGSFDIRIEDCNKISVEIPWRVWKFDYQGTQSMHLCHQSSHTICGYFQDLKLWNRRDPHTSEMQPCLPTVPEGIRGQG